MANARRFPAELVDAIDSSTSLMIRAGSGRHRFIRIWAVVVERRVFARSWTLKEQGWYRTFLVEPTGAIQIDGREIPVRAVHTRSERLKAAVDRAYRAKYHTPSSLKYVRGLQNATRRNTTTELKPL
jgi:hypothetical protein